MERQHLGCLRKSVVEIVGYRRTPWKIGKRNAISVALVMNHRNDLHDIALLPSRLPVYGAQRPGWDFTRAHVNRDATGPGGMFVLNVVAGSFPRNYPAIPPEPGHDIPGLIRVFGPAHDCPSPLMCIGHAQQMDPSTLECVSVCIGFQAKCRGISSRRAREPPSGDRRSHAARITRPTSRTRNYHACSWPAGASALWPRSAAAAHDEGGTQIRLGQASA
jgi:hypothetical protein